METPPHDNLNPPIGRRQTRSALSEIPARLGMLSVSDDGTTLIGLYMPCLRLQMKTGSLYSTIN